MSESEQNKSEQNTGKNAAEDIEIISMEDLETTTKQEPVSDAAPASKEKKSSFEIIRYVILVIAAGVFIFAVANLVRIYYHYHKGNTINNNIRNEVVDSTTAATTPEDPSDAASYQINPTLQINFARLKELNANAVGWIDVPSVSISYPVVRGDDNEFYLTHAFNDEFSWSGAIFMDYRHSMDVSDPHVFIYGHHMKDGSMFCELLKYDDESFYQENAGNNYFYIYLENSVKVYEIFSVCDVTLEENPTAYTISFNSSFTIEDYAAYLQSIELYDTGIEIEEGDQIVTLYTCQVDSATGIRHLVHGKLITEIDY